MLQPLEALQFSVLRLNGIHKNSNNIKHITCTDPTQIKHIFHITINKIKIIRIIIISLLKLHILPCIITIHLLTSLDKYHKLAKLPSNSTIMGLFNKIINLNIKTMSNISNSISNLGREYHSKIILYNLIVAKTNRMSNLMNQCLNSNKFKISHNFNSSNNSFRLFLQGSFNILNILKALFLRMSLWVSILFVTKQLSTIAITTIFMNPLMAP